MVADSHRSGLGSMLFEDGLALLPEDLASSIHWHDEAGGVSLALNSQGPFDGPLLNRIAHCPLNDFIDYLSVTI